MIATNDEAYKFLINYLDIFRRSILQAHEEQKTALTTESRAKIRKRGISVIMNDLVTHHLRANLTGLPSVQIKERYAQTQLIFSSAFLMKCKQSRRGHISFTGTQLMLDFMNQLQSVFPLMPSPITNIVLTYTWNKTRTEIVKISILCPANEHNNYFWQIDVPLATTPQIVPMIQPQQAPELPTETKPIVPKAKRIKKSKKGLSKKKGLNNKDGQQGQADKS